MQTSFCVDGARRVANQPPLEGSIRGTLRSARAAARAGRTSVDVIRKETHCPVRRVARDDAKQKAGDGCARAAHGEHTWNQASTK